jgi:hypothetical protein
MAAAIRGGSARSGRTLAEHGHLSRLRIHGTRARATVRGAGPAQRWAATNRDGRWQMSCCLPPLRFPHGGGAAPSSSRAVRAFLARADRLCAQAGRRIEALPRVTPATALRTARAGAALDAEFLARLRALTPPASVARRWRELLATSSRQEALDPQLISAIERRDAGRIAAITAQQVALTRRADAEAVGLDLPACAQDYVPSG